MLLVIPFWVTGVVTLCVVALALVRGGMSERLVAALILADVAWSMTHPKNYGDDLPGELLRDAVLSFAVTAVALHARRYWTLAAASVCWVAVATELVQMIAPVNLWAYGTAELTWWYLLVGCLALGAWRAGAAQRPRSDETA
jgi:hypothetical protein